MHLVTDVAEHLTGSQENQRELLNRVVAVVTQALAYSNPRDWNSGNFLGHRLQSRGALLPHPDLQSAYKASLRCIYRGPDDLKSRSLELDSTVILYDCNSDLSLWRLR